MTAGVFRRVLKGLHRVLSLYERPWIRRRNELICAMFSPGLLPTQRLLDIGGGDGRLAETIRARCGTSPVLVDNRSYEGRRDDLAFILADAAHLPFRANQFDVCLLSTPPSCTTPPIPRARCSRQRGSAGAT